MNDIKSVIVISIRRWQFTVTDLINNILINNFSTSSDVIYE